MLLPSPSAYLTLESLGIWEQMHNLSLKGLEFEIFKKEPEARLDKDRASAKIPHVQMRAIFQSGLNQAKSGLDILINVITPFQILEFRMNFIVRSSRIENV